MNNGYYAPFRSQLSLKVIIKWSQARLLFAAVLTLVLSFAVGMRYMIVHDDVQGTWSIGSYITTTGACKFPAFESLKRWRVADLESYHRSFGSPVVS